VAVRRIPNCIVANPTGRSPTQIVDHSRIVAEDGSDVNLSGVTLLPDAVETIASQQPSQHVRLWWIPGVPFEPLPLEGLIGVSTLGELLLDRIFVAVEATMRVPVTTESEAASVTSLRLVGAASVTPVSHHSQADIESLARH
jgi:hypothetical protein